MGSSDRSDESELENLGSSDLLSGDGERMAVPSARSGVFFRRLAHNAWRILILWLLLSIALTYGIYRFIEPTYMAFNYIKLDSYEPVLFDQSLVFREPSGSEFSYLQTEIEMIRANSVLDIAVADSEIANYSSIKKSLDPKADLKKKLDLQIVPNTHLIRVALESTDPKEAADIVNAVIGAYTEISTWRNSPSGSGPKFLIRVSQDRHSQALNDLRVYHAHLGHQIEETRSKLRDLAARDDAFASKEAREGKADPAVVKLQDFKKWHSHVSEVEASFLRDDQERFYRMFDEVDRKLESLEFVKGKAGIKVTHGPPTEIPIEPIPHHRLEYMALAPAVVLLSLVGLFLMFGRDRPKQERHGKEK
jgi:hypothetical protein